MTERTIPIADLAKTIRSKNAKSFGLTLDILFKDEESYALARSSGCVTPQRLRELYPGLELTDFVWFEPGLAVKASFQRPRSVGSPGDPDVFGCQQQAPLYTIEIPVDTVRVLVIGSALREFCEDQAALGLRFVEEAATAPRYRLLVVDEGFAALVEDEAAGTAVKGELVEVDSGRWAKVVATEPDGILPAPVELSDGRFVLAAFSDPDRVADRATDITAFGGFAAYRASLERGG